MTQNLTHPTTPNPLYTLFHLPNSGVRISSVSSPFSLSRNHTNLSDPFFPKPIPFLQTLTLKKATAMSFSHHNDDDDNDNNNRRRLYNPYQDLQLPAQTLYKLPTSPEFLFQEEAVALRRSWGENLTYYTGIGYLGGAIVGGGKGLIEGLKASEPGDTTKLRVNRILNAGGHGGRKFGNRAGVIGLLYAGLESGMVAVRDTDDVINSVVAGLGTGALFKAASGPRSAAVAGAIGGVVVGLAVTGKQVLKRYVPI